MRGAQIPVGASFTASTFHHRCAPQAHYNIQEPGPSSLTSPFHRAGYPSLQSRSSQQELGAIPLSPLSLLSQCNYNAASSTTSRDTPTSVHTSEDELLPSICLRVLRSPDLENEAKTLGKGKVQGKAKDKKTAEERKKAAALRQAKYRLRNKLFGVPLLGGMPCTECPNLRIKDHDAKCVEKCVKCKEAASQQCVTTSPHVRKTCALKQEKI